MQNKPKIDRIQPIKSQNARPTIGVLTTENIVRYLPLNWLGPLDAARKQAVNQFCFIGGPFRSLEGFLAQAAVVFDLVDPEQFDGLIIWAEAVGPFLTKEEIQTFCRRYASVPIVTIERVFEGIPGILMDNYQGMREAMIHLIEAHGHRRIAFLRGPVNHLGAQERYRAYVETLAEYGIPFDANLVGPPREDWDGTAMIKLLLDERQADFEAVAAAADHLALCALRVLQARGISVPDDLALIGYDDCIEGRAVTPPLTTLRAPFYEMGQQAIEMVLALIEGQQVPEQMLVPAKLIVRQSCGCLAPTVVQAAAELNLSGATAASCEITLPSWQEEMLSKMMQVGDTPLTSLSHDLMTQFLDQFMAALNAEPASLFVQAVDRILREVAAAGDEVTVWHGVVSVLRQHLLPYLRGEMLARAENLWQQARVAISEMAQRVEAYQRVQVEQQTQMLREIGQALITTFDVDELMDVLAQGLLRLGIPRAYLALYDDPKNPLALSRLILAYDENRRVQFASDGPRFPSQQLVPVGMLPRDKAYCMVVKPLYFREDQLGFGLFEVGPRDVNVYEALRSEISSALHGALLVTALQNAQREIMRLEKEALEIQMAGGFAHEMRNALTGAGLALNTVIKTEKTLCQETSESLQALFHHIEPHIPVERWDEIIALLQTIDHNQEMLDNAIRVVSRCITNALDITTMILNYAKLGKEGPGQEAVNLKQVIDDLIQEHQQEFAERQIAFRVQIETTHLLVGDASHFYAILNNIVLNARDAFLGVKDSRERLITITLTEDAQVQRVRITDNADGILPEHLPKIFEPFFSTKPNTGTGLGLSFVAKLVPLYHGTIEVTSEPGKGTTFTLAFPLPG